MLTYVKDKFDASTDTEMLTYVVKDVFDAHDKLTAYQSIKRVIQSNEFDRSQLFQQH